MNHFFGMHVLCLCMKYMHEKNLVHYSSVDGNLNYFFIGNYFFKKCYFIFLNNVKLHQKSHIFIVKDNLWDYLEKFLKKCVLIYYLFKFNLPMMLLSRITTLQTKVYLYKTACIRLLASLQLACEA